MKKLNKEFDVEAMGDNCFCIRIIDDLCDNNIKACLNEDLQLKYTDEELEAHSMIAPCNLVYEELDPDDETNEDAQIKLDGEVTFTFGQENFPLKGVFLTTDNGYVMAYVIHSNTINITNQMIFEDELILIETREGAVNG